MSIFTRRVLLKALLGAAIGSVIIPVLWGWGDHQPGFVIGWDDLFSGVTFVVVMPYLGYLVGSTKYEEQLQVIQNLNDLNARKRVGLKPPATAKKK